MQSSARRVLTWLLAATLAALSFALTFDAGQASAASATSATSPTKQLEVDFYHARVTLTVPRAWHVSHTRPTRSCGCGGDFRPVCIVASGDYGLDPDNCVLMVGGNAELQTPDYPLPEWRLPKCRNWATTADAGSLIGHRQAEYREFLDRCTGARSEQWTSLTTPSVALWHPIRGDRSDSAAARAAATAHVAGHVAAGRTLDNGRLRGVQLRNGHAVVSIDRVVLDLDGTVINNNTATYSYRLGTPATNPDARECVRFLSGCTAHQLVAQFRKGTHPADGTRALDGRLVLVLRQAGSPFSISAGGGYKFTSTGDSGHCGC